MEFLQDFFFGLAMCALGVCGSALIKEENKRTICHVSIVLVVIFLLSGFVAKQIKHQSEVMEQERDTALFLPVCHEYFNNGDYTNAVNSIVTHGVGDAQSCMVYAYFLANGYGVEKNIQSSIQFYKEAKKMGDDRAESNMVISVLRNCSTREKIDVLKSAYKSGNEIAIRYVNYVVDSLNASPEDNNITVSAETIWDLDEKTLLSILNGPFYVWASSNRTYTTTVSTSSTPTFTRRFLYKIGDKNVYEECSLIVNNDFPDWLQEDVW